MEVCKATSLDFTPEMSESVEKETRSQYKSTLWYKYRAGRVTLCCLKSVCHTDSTNPAQSLIKSICYPKELAFTSKQTDWGQKQEKSSRELYIKLSMPQHDNLVVSDSGLVINPQWPYIGASPDGIVECMCHGKCVLEIKCSYSYCGETVLSATLNDTNFCLKRDDDGALHLDPGYSYYYQVQTQMFVCGVEYCDFCLCTFPKEEGSLPHIECIKKNEEF